MKTKLILFLLIASGSTFAQTNPAITSWLINTNKTTGSYYLFGNPTPVPITTEVNVQKVQYSNDYVYVEATGIPAFTTGPFYTGPQRVALANNYKLKIPLNPVVATTKQAVPNGAIAVLINGTVVYKAGDGMSYNRAGYWNSNAVYFENSGFDCNHGHPGPMISDYHHHQNPSAFKVETVPTSDICNVYLADGLYVPNETAHGPIIGFAADGYPIYGGYGYTDPLDPSSAIKRMTPSYRLRNITSRTTLPDGTVAAGPGLTEQVQIAGTNPAVYLPAVLGAYLEDFEYVANLGDLDQYNGRFCKTPEYPNGTYCYFATIDGDKKPVYPYVIGSHYYGVINLTQYTTISEAVTTYNSSLSVSNNDLEQIGVTVFPNPTSNILVVQSYSPVVSELKIELFDVNGKLISNDILKQGSTMCYLNLEAVYSGLYFVKISDNTNSVTKKVVVTH